MRILCGTDLLPKTESAIDRAGMLAAALGAKLSLLHVAVPSESDQMLEQDVQRANSRLQARASPPRWRHGRSPSISVRTGSPARVLVEMARELDADLVILGMRRKRPVRDALVGTTALQLLSVLTCPVLIVRRMPLGAYQNVLLALDRSKASAEVLRTAEALVMGADARASVVHAYQPQYSELMTSAGITDEVIDQYTSSWKRKSKAGLRDMLMQVSHDASRYELILENATTTDAVGNVVRRLNPDLLVLGTRGRSRLKRALLGSVAQRIMAAARSDILVVPVRSSGAAWKRRRSERQSLDVVTGF
jgi:nucleotide-binding universal stress UspA family protein